MPLQPYTGDALLQIGLIVKVRIVKTSFTLDSGNFLSAKVSRYTVYCSLHIYRIAGIFRGYKLSRFLRIGSHPRNFIPPKIRPQMQWAWRTPAAL